MIRGGDGCGVDGRKPGAVVGLAVVLAVGKAVGLAVVDRARAERLKLRGESAAFPPTAPIPKAIPL